MMPGLLLLSMLSRTNDGDEVPAIEWKFRTQRALTSVMSSSLTSSSLLLTNKPLKLENMVDERLNWKGQEKNPNLFLFLKIEPSSMRYERIYNKHSGETDWSNQDEWRNLARRDEDEWAKIGNERMTCCVFIPLTLFWSPMSTYLGTLRPELLCCCCCCAALLCCCCCWWLSRYVGFYLGTAVGIIGFPKSGTII